jgi:16S rRNA (cytosine1407-C5)-methyltransferase
VKSDFLTYIQETFDFTASEMAEFSVALSKPLKKTVRVNTNKISIGDFKKLAENKSLPPDRGESEGGWELTKTLLGKNMFYIDRTDTSIPLGHTLEHINGYFYVQELAASSSPFYMSGDTVDTANYTILDMSASPGGKTTGLAEYYPNALIIANELDKMRLKQLFENIDRMGAKNTLVTNYDGRFFKNIPESFDKILLDAPCSGEGTAYKTEDALKYWNIKNIKKVAKLQFGLLESGLLALKVGGEIVYSTCTLNRLENEEVVEKILEKYKWSIEVVALSPQNTPIQLSPARGKGKLQCDEVSSLLEGETERGTVWENFIRSWPHKNNTGGFFVAKLRKTQSFWDTKNTFPSVRQWFEKITPTEEKHISQYLEKNYKLSLSWKYFTYRSEVYYIENMQDFFWENTFLYKIGIKIGKLESGIFEPFFILGTSFGIFKKQSLNVSKETLHSFLKGEEREMQEPDAYYQIVYENTPAGLIKIKNGVWKTILDNGFLRK